jgi:hypothetical protein
MVLQETVLATVTSQTHCEDWFAIKIWALKFKYLLNAIS